MILAIPVTHKHKQKVDKHGEALMYNQPETGHKPLSGNKHTSICKNSCGGTEEGKTKEDRT